MKFLILDHRMGALLRMILFLSLLISANSSSRYKGIGWNKAAAFNVNVQPYAATSNFYNCNGKIGDCIDPAEEMMLDSEASKQVLAVEKFVIYKFFDKEHVPCDKRGQSYYSCDFTKRKQK
ncbi:hypothetical protein POM88_034778 [Heracleum sosnowskyi]|uniref:Uncharacterized protein n=1 Tax=Heracleum sosnowskyi TaxID=360622 RepID=A0AAD8MCM2_9APIA|nr:hypothetical protein POM88_034778 [Heracleum sosnowskyi]